MSQRDTADNIRQGAEASYASARQNASLSEVGRRTQLARVYVAAKRDMDALRESTGSTAESDRVRNMRTAFAAPTDSGSVLSYRDATDRAYAADDADAGLALINRAIDTGDTLLARAVGQRAFDEVKGGGIFGTGGGWHPVLEAYANSCGAAVTDAINGLLSQSSKDPFSSLFDFILVKPSELNGMTDSELAQL